MPNVERVFLGPSGESRLLQRAQWGYRKRKRREGRLGFLAELGTHMFSPKPASSEGLAVDLGWIAADFCGWLFSFVFFWGGETLPSCFFLFFVFFFFLGGGCISPPKFALCTVHVEKRLARYYQRLKGLEGVAPIRPALAALADVSCPKQRKPLTIVGPLAIDLSEANKRWERAQKVIFPLCVSKGKLTPAIELDIAKTAVTGKRAVPETNLRA